MSRDFNIRVFGSMQSWFNWVRTSLPFEFQGLTFQVIHPQDKTTEPDLFILIPQGQSGPDLVDIFARKAPVIVLLPAEKMKPEITRLYWLAGADDVLRIPQYPSSSPGSSLAYLRDILRNFVMRKENRQILNAGN